MKNGNDKKFSEWLDAVEWAEDNDRELVNIGTAQGTDVVAEWANEKSRLEIHADYCEYDAEGERNSVYCVVKCYKVVIWLDNEYAAILEDADSREEAFEMFESWKEQLS
jgi:hypothetical protein